MKKIYLLGPKGGVPDRRGLILCDGNWVVNGAYEVTISEDGKTITCNNYPTLGIIGTYLMDVPHEMSRGDYQYIFESMASLIDAEYKKQYIDLDDENAIIPLDEFKIISKYLDDAADKIARVVAILDKSEAWSKGAEYIEFKNMYLRICKASKYFDETVR
jgi:hypothetical protein